MFLKSSKKIFSIFAASVLFATTAYADFNFFDNLRPPEMYFTPEAVEIYRAATRGDVNSIKRHVIEGTRIESKGPPNPGKSLQQITLLSYAVGMNNAKAIESLIAAGANPTFLPTPRQDNTYTFAILRKNINGLKEIFKHFPASRLSDKEKAKHLFTSARYGCQECLEFLFEQGYDVNMLNDKKENIFIKALHYREWDIALWLLKDKNISVKVESIEGITPENAVQFYEFQQLPKSLSRDKLKEMQTILETKYGIPFPVLTRIQVLEKNNMIESNKDLQVPTIQ